MSQHDTDEAGSYDNGPRVRSALLDNTIPGSVIKLRWQLECYDIQKNVERESQRKQQASRYMYFILLTCFLIFFAKIAHKVAKSNIFPIFKMNPTRC